MAKEAKGTKAAGEASEDNEREYDEEGAEQRRRRNKYRYQQLKFKGMVYKVGEYVLIRESKKSNMVAQLKEIIGQGGDAENPKRPMIELLWYYKKDDLDKEAAGISAAEWRSLGENEVFCTNFQSKVYADLLNGKCKVWDLKDYDGKPGLGPHDFYTRASYDLTSVRLLFLTP
jgi:hypothetical protein